MSGREASHRKRTGLVRMAANRAEILRENPGQTPAFTNIDMISWDISALARRLLGIRRGGLDSQSFNRPTSLLR